MFVLPQLEQPTLKRWEKGIVIKKIQVQTLNIRKYCEQIYDYKFEK